MTTRAPLVLVGGKIVELPTGDKIGGAPAGADGTDVTSPLTTVGDLWGYDSADARVPVGTDGQFLTADSGQSLGVKWNSLSQFNRTGLTVPLASSFSSIGTGTTLTDKVGRLQLATTAVSTTQIRGGTVASISTPYTLDMSGGFVGTPAANDSIWFGIGVSDGTKYRMWYVGGRSDSNTNGVLRGAIDSWTNVTTFSANVAFRAMIYNPASFHLRLTDNGTNRVFYISPNGRDFAQFYTEATNTFLTPTKFVFASYCANTAMAMKAYVTHWLVTSSVLGDAS